MKVHFWGTRGSIPSPAKAADIEAKIIQAILGLPDIDTGDVEAVQAYVGSLPPLLRGTAGGNTPCVQIEAGEEHFVIDAGSGLRELGWKLMEGPCGQGKGTVHLLISHLHWDHIQGFLMFTPAFVPGNRIVLYGVHDIQSALEMQQQPPMWPVSLADMAADIEFVCIEAGGTFEVGPLSVQTMLNTHPNTSYSFRIEDQYSVLVFCSDIEYKELDDATLQPYLDFFHSADALIFDAQYTLRESWRRVGWGHSSAMIGVDLARAAGVKRLLLFHHDPTYSDQELDEIRRTAVAYQEQNPASPSCEILIAYEGLTLDLAPPGAVGLQLAADGETAILTPARVLDELNVEQLAQQLAHLEGTSSSSIIDLSDVETLTMTSLKALVTFYQTHQDVSVVLAAPSESARQVIRLAGYQDYFAIYPSVEAALSAVRAREALNLPGQLLKSRYQIEEQLGDNWLGVVLKATDTQTHQTVVLKVLAPTFSEETVRRVMRQAPQILALDHPSIVKVYSWDEDGMRVEEFVGARRLQRIMVEEGPFTGERAVEIALNIAYALEYAHSRGLVHGSLRPSNILITEKGLKIADFGLAHLSESRKPLDDPYLSPRLPYLSPEQILDQPIDARTDLYALGVILYQMLTGHLPFEGPEPDIRSGHLHRTPKSLRSLNPQISLPLEHLVLKLLSKNPNDRYASAGQARRVSSSLIAPAEDWIAQRWDPLVGREQELRIVQDSWAETRQGRGQLVFIAGEQGIGKTSFIQQAAAQLMPQVRLAGFCQELEESTPYALFAQVLQAYFATVPPEFLDEQACQLCANFIRLAPELRQMLPDLSDPPPLEPEQEHLRLMGSLTQFVSRATKERPWLLLLDDLQWADRSSLELLRYLGRHTPSMALMIVGTYREEGLERGHALLRTLRDLSSYATYHHLVLERLDQPGVARILTQVWGKNLPDTLVEHIYQHTGGNPFYVEQVAHGLLDDGLVAMRDGQWYFPAPDELRLPQSVREAIWHRIGRLSPDTQALLSQASVLGQTFRFDDLRAMSGLSEWQLLEHLDAALERRLVQEVPGDTMLRFHHTEIQNVLYQDLGPLRRRVLHRQAAETLEQRGEPERLAEELAYHYYEAGEVEQGVAYSIQAATQAEAAYANETALMWYKRALEMLERVDPGEAARFSATRLSAHEQLGGVLALVGRYDDAMKEYAAARALLEAARPLSPQQSHHMASLCRHTADVYEKRSEYRMALEWLQRGLSYLGEEPSLELIKIYATAAFILIRQGSNEAACVQGMRALDLARAAQLPQLEANSLRILGIISWNLGHYSEAEAYYEQALAIYRQLGDLMGESASLNNLGILYGALGDYVGARSFYEMALQLYCEVGCRWGETAVLSNLGLVSWDVGYYAESKGYHEQSLAIRREIGDRWGEGVSLNNLGIVARGQGQYVLALRYHEQALEKRHEIGDRQGQGASLSDLGAVYCDLGDTDRAWQFLEQALAIRREIGDRAGEATTLVCMGLLFHHMGEHERALEHGQLALDLAQELGEWPQQARAQTVVGHALVALGRLEEAVNAYEQGLHRRRDLGQPHLALEPLAGLAYVSLAQGDLDRALAHAVAIWHFIEDSSDRRHCLDGLDEPLKVYWLCYQVLDAAHDPRASQVLADAHTLLQARASAIDDEGLRRSFLEHGVRTRILHAVAEGSLDQETGG